MFGNNPPTPSTGDTTPPNVATVILPAGSAPIILANSSRNVAGVVQAPADHGADTHNAVAVRAVLRVLLGVAAAGRLNAADMAKKESEDALKRRRRAWTKTALDAMLRDAEGRSVALANRGWPKHPLTLGIGVSHVATVDFKNLSPNHTLDEDR